MKNIFVPVILMLLVCSSFTTTPVPASGPADDEKATVIFYRTGEFNSSLSNYSIFAGDEKICKLSNNKYIEYKCKPGKIIFSAHLSGASVMKKETEIEVETEAGKTYYVSCNVKYSVTRSRMELSEVTASTAKRDMQDMTKDNCSEKDSDSSADPKHK